MTWSSVFLTRTVLSWVGLVSLAGCVCSPMMRKECDQR
jgi:hypothetical protein